MDEKKHGRIETKRRSYSFNLVVVVVDRWLSDSTELLYKATDANTDVLTRLSVADERDSSVKQTQFKPDRLLLRAHQKARYSRKHEHL